MREKIKQAILTILIACFAAGLVYMLNPIQAYALTYAEGDTWIDTSGNTMTAEEASQWDIISSTTSTGSSEESLGYRGKIIDGRIVGKVPAIINGEPVKSMHSTFMNCKNLIYAPTIPDTVKNMDSTFYGCSSLQEAPAIPSSVTNMYSTFYGCSSLQEAPEIPSSVTDMTHTFNGCTSLHEAPEIPNGIKELMGTFWGCTSLTKAPAIPKTVTRIDYIFKNCTSLVEAPIIPTSMIYMSSAFEGCTSLVKAPTIPNSVSNMESTFEGCTSLVAATNIPSSIMNLNYTYKNCTSLTKRAKIPTNIWFCNGTYDGCPPEILDVIIDTDGKQMSEQEVSRWNYGIDDNTASLYKYTGNFLNGEIVGKVPALINGIPVTNMRSTFYECKNLVKAPAIPDTVTNMDSTFYGCNNLTTAPVIPDSVTNLYSTFENCTSLTTAPVIPNSVNNIENMFLNCTSLTKAPEIPSSVTSLYCTFSGCTSLIEAPEIPNSVTSLYYTFDGCTSLITAPIVPNSVTNMTHTFSRCTSLTQAPVIPNSVVDMYETFGGCTSLVTAPAIPDSVTNMRGIFSGCSNLETVKNISNNVTNLEAAFYECTSLTQVPTIPSSVTNMQIAFAFCQQLYGNVDILFTMKEQYDSIFYGCTASITGTVTNKEGKSIPNAAINTNGTTVYTDTQGKYIITGLDQVGTYNITVLYEDSTASQTVKLVRYENGVQNFELDISTTEIQDPDVPLGPGNVVNGTTNGNLPIYGTVNPINMIDVTLPITMSFVIKADRTLQKPQDIQIKSNCPAPLDTKILSINKSTTAPELAAPTKYTDDQWNNLTRAQTYKEIGLALNGYDLSAPGNSIGNLKSAFNDADPSNPNTQQLALDLDAKYGKAWDNSEDYIFTYNVVFEFSML